jgi:WD repeat-containing protein 35
MMHKGHWFEEMINNRNKSVVRDMRWSSNGEKICIVYEDGAVIVGSVEGNRLWGKELNIKLAHIEWSPDGRIILFGTPEGELKAYDYVGNYLFQLKIFCHKGEVLEPIAGVQWFDVSKVGYSYDDKGEAKTSLAVAFKNGKMQLMKNENDDNPILIDSGMKTVECIKWNPNGNVLAVAGSI